MVDETLKTCITCGESKQLDEFYVIPRNKSGRQGSCKTCDRARIRFWQDSNPDQHRANLRRQKLQSRYGITPEQYDIMLDDQNGCCACCGADTPGGYGDTFRVDHDHETGVVRGLLCQVCNAGIGFLGDNVAGVTRALGYLQRSDGG